MEVERFGGGGGHATALGRGHRAHAAAAAASPTGGGRVLAALGAGARWEYLKAVNAVLKPINQ